MRHLTVPVRELQIRAAGEGSPDIAGRVAGYAMTWAEVARIEDWMDTWDEKFEPGAFSESLQKDADRIVMLSQHDTDHVIGRPDVMKEDATGLYFEADIVSTTHGSDMAKLVRAGVIRGVSIGFDVQEESVVKRENQPDLRLVTKAGLWEASLVTYPAFESTSVMALRDKFKGDPYARLMSEARGLTPRSDADRSPDEAQADRDGAAPLEPAEVAVLTAMVQRCKGSNANKSRIESMKSLLDELHSDLFPLSEDRKSRKAEMARRLLELRSAS